MIPWIQIASAKVPGDTSELRLKQRGHEFSIMLGANELMNSRLSGSEEALATLAFSKLKERLAPSCLIGGLGMGFTLRAALTSFPPGAEVHVAELVRDVVDWARGPMQPVYGGSLDDPRVQVHVTDVGLLIRQSVGTFDAILLDVDNGPDGLTRKSNDQLYSPAGLQAAKTALRPGGVLAVWSSGPDETFTRRLKDAGLKTEAVNVRANGKKGGARHVIWLAQKA